MELIKVFNINFTYYSGDIVRFYGSKYIVADKNTVVKGEYPNESNKWHKLKTCNIVNGNEVRFVTKKRKKESQVSFFERISMWFKFRLKGKKQ